jgi:predicted lipid-binding transport protein (Tim44 family)
VLFARSDTFSVRAYGDTVNPATGAIESRAWCEAMVQRLPDYFDAAQPADTAPAALNALNQAYGRRFKVVHFQWLSSSDI